MKITYVYGTRGPVVDLKTTAEVPSMNDHNDHTNWLNGHEDRLNKQQGWLDQHGGWLRTHDKSIDGVTKTVLEHKKWIDGHKEWIRGIESKVNGMPQALRETLEQILNETYAPQFDSFTKLLESLKTERNEVAAQLEKLRREREETQAELSKLAALKQQYAEAKAAYEDQLQKLKARMSGLEELRKKMSDDFSRQVTEFKLSVPVPKKFAKFLFVKTGK